MRQPIVTMYIFQNQMNPTGNRNIIQIHLTILQQDFAIGLYQYDFNIKVLVGFDYCAIVTASLSSYTIIFLYNFRICSLPIYICYFFIQLLY